MALAWNVLHTALNWWPHKDFEIKALDTHDQQHARLSGSMRQGPPKMHKRHYQVLQDQV